MSFIILAQIGDIGLTGEDRFSPLVLRTRRFHYRLTPSSPIRARLP